MEDAIDRLYLPYKINHRIDKANAGAKKFNKKKQKMYAIMVKITLTNQALEDLEAI